MYEVHINLSYELGIKVKLQKLKFANVTKQEARDCLSTERNSLTKSFFVAAFLDKHLGPYYRQL